MRMKQLILERERFASGVSSGFIDPTERTSEDPVCGFEEDDGHKTKGFSLLNNTHFVLHKYFWSSQRNCKGTKV